MSEVGVEIVKTEEVKESGIKYLNINVSNSEVERNPDRVRLCADAGILEYVKPKTGHWKKIQSGDKDFPESIVCSRCGHENSYLDFGISSVPIGKSFKKSKYCPNCGARMAEKEIANE